MIQKQILFIQIIMSKRLSRQMTQNREHRHVKIVPAEQHIHNRDHDPLSQKRTQVHSHLPRLFRPRYRHQRHHQRQLRHLQHLRRLHIQQ